MPKATTRTREEARRLFLTGEMQQNAEIAARLGVKPHTVGMWRRQEDWDGLRLKIDRRAAELFCEKIATDRVSLNVRHFRFWEVVLAKLAEDLKGKKTPPIREMERIAGILERAQKGQRVAKGMSANGETDESVRAQAQAEIRRLIDAFIDSVKENVADEETRDRIRRSIFDAIPEETDDGTGEPGDPVTH
jgi:uncharacterized protein YjcR